MYGYWDRPRDFAGKILIMIAYSSDDLSDRIVRRYFATLGPIRERHVRKNGHIVGTFYYRIGYDYRPSRGPQSSDAKRSDR
jgi:dolichol-phosphate mannosyltransferase